MFKIYFRVTPDISGATPHSVYNGAETFSSITITFSRASMKK